MSGGVTMAPAPPKGRRRRGKKAEGAAARLLLIGVALAFLATFLLGPLLNVFISAFSKGAGPFFEALATSDSLAAIELTLTTAAISVPLNVVFGMAAAWLISKYDFPGKSLLITLIDLPFSVSPVISGLVFVLLFGAQGVLHPLVEAWDVKVIFAVPGIVLATTFVTFPLVAREVLAVMQAQGNDEEEAALTLGANGWQVLFHVTLRKVRWGLLYGVILCNARAMGEFGAVSVVSGHIRGETNTMPLHIEILYNEYNFVGAFAVASLLALLAVGTLVVKKAAEWTAARSRMTARAEGAMGVAGAAPAATALDLRRAS
jgi:sulfate transport system permease protein